jgi:2-(1,2-epoxy-1,2-dihydrophenyl)acetyl-CoA isomerase
MTRYADMIEQGAREQRELVTVERRGSHAVVTLDEAERLNPLSAGLVLQLQARLAELATDPELRAVVLTGSAPAFSAGGDLDMIERGATAIRDAAEPSDTTDAWRWIRRQFGGVVRTITSTDKAFIAAVNGPAAGVGLAFAFACDIVLASESAVLVPAFGRLGLVPEVGTSWLLTRRLGYQAALALYVRGRHIEAAEALELGLVQEVHPDTALAAAAERWCERVSRMPAHAFEMTKPLLRAAADAPWEQALKLEEFAEANCFSTATLPAAAAAIRAAEQGEHSPRSGGVRNASGGVM